MFTSNVAQVSKWFIASGANKQSLAEKGQCVMDAFGLKGTIHLKLGSKSLEIQLFIRGTGVGTTVPGSWWALSEC